MIFPNEGLEDLNEQVNQPQDLQEQVENVHEHQD